MAQLFSCPASDKLPACSAKRVFAGAEWAFDNRGTVFAVEPGVADDDGRLAGPVSG